MRVAVFGLGYAGTVSAACLASADHDVWGVDVDEEKVRVVTAGSSPVVEPGLDELVRTVTDAGSLHATVDAAEALDGADVAVVCVGTPSSAHGRVELSQVERAVREIAEASRRAAPPRSGVRSVVMRSTVPVGTVDELVAPILAAETPSGWRFGMAMCPEFLRESSGIADFFDPPFIVIGTSDGDTAAAVANLFAFVGRDVRVVGTREAEALKYVCNAFHATKVSFANELARLMRSVGVDSRTVMELFCEDTRLNLSDRYLRPGFAFGGSCLPKDLRVAARTSARTNNVDLPLMSGTLAVERAHRQRHRRPHARDERPRRRAPRAQLQARDRRSAREPERRARRDAARQGHPAPHLRPDRQPGTARRREPQLRRVEAPAPAPAARRQRDRSTRRRRRRDRVVDRSRRDRGAARDSPAGRHRPQRSPRSRGGGHPRLRGHRMVTGARRGARTSAEPCARSRPHHRAEPPGSVRSPGLARMPDVEGRRRRGARRLPEGPGRSDARGRRRDLAPQVPAEPRGLGPRRLPRRVLVVVRR